jgi:hypothetical protein
MSTMRCLTGLAAAGILLIGAPLGAQGPSDRASDHPAHPSHPTMLSAGGSWSRGEAQFATRSRLRGEPVAVTELSLTPGAPRAVQFGIEYRF